jgi:hypothetical protein
MYVRTGERRTGTFGLAFAILLLVFYLPTPCRHSSLVHQASAGTAYLLTASFRIDGVKKWRRGPKTTTNNRVLLPQILTEVTKKTGCLETEDGSYQDERVVLSCVTRVLSERQEF